MSKGQPDVSVIIPAHNAELFIGRALRSVLRQTYTSWEIIVIDDGSNDGTLQVARTVLQGIDAARIVVRSEVSGLPAVARNVGLDAARGNFVAFLDADDFWFPWKLQRQASVLEKYPEYDFVHSYMWSFRNHNILPGLFFIPHPRRRKGNYEDVIKANPVMTSSVLVRRSAIQAVGGFSTDARLGAGEDYELWLRLARETPLLYLSEIHGGYRVHKSSISSGVDFLEVNKLIADLNRFPRHSRISRPHKLLQKVSDVPFGLYCHLLEAPLRHFLGIEPRIANLESN